MRDKVKEYLNEKEGESSLKKCFESITNKPEKISLLIETALLSKDETVIRWAFEQAVKLLQFDFSGFSRKFAVFCGGESELISENLKPVTPHVFPIDTDSKSAKIVISYFLKKHPSDFHDFLEKILEKAPGHSHASFYFNGSFMFSSPDWEEWNSAVCPALYVPKKQKPNLNEFFSAIRPHSQKLIPTRTKFLEIFDGIEFTIVESDKVATPTLKK